MAAARIAKGYRQEAPIGFVSPAQHQLTLPQSIDTSYEPYSRDTVSFFSLASSILLRILRW